MNTGHNIGIEEKAELIESSATRYYFREVYSSYVNGNYRAAVVTLWSVLVCDAVYKTQKLYELTEEPWAKKKLAEIEALQKANSKSSDWELNLFEEFYSNKKFIGIGEISNIRDIQQKRHLCAHPILSEDNALYTPNKESVKSMILNALDDFLIRNNYYGKDVFPILLNTLKDNSEYYSDIKKIRPLVNKYCQRLTPTAVYQIFKNFYKFSFKLDNQEAEENRRLNQRALSILYAEVKKSAENVQKIKEDIEFFENISFKSSILGYLYHFLSLNRDFYSYFSKEIRERFIVHRDKESEDDTYYTLKLCSSFTFESADNYFNFLKEGFSNGKINNFDLSIYEYISDVYQDIECQEELKELAIIYFSNSNSYAEADNRFDFIQTKELLESFNADQLNRLVESFDTNSQIRLRRRGAIDRHKLERRLQEITG